MKMFNRKIIFILLLLFLVPTIVNATTITTDYFTDDDYTSNPAWSVQTGTFNVTLNKLYNDGASGRITTPASFTSNALSIRDNFNRGR